MSTVIHLSVSFSLFSCKQIFFQLFCKFAINRGLYNKIRHGTGSNNYGKGKEIMVQVKKVCTFVQCFLAGNLLLTGSGTATHCRGISQFHLHTCVFIRRQNEPYLPLVHNDDTAILITIKFANCLLVPSLMMMVMTKLKKHTVLYSINCCHLMLTVCEFCT